MMLYATILDDSSGMPVAGVEVWPSDDAGNPWDGFTKTDSTGSVSFNSRNAGHFTLKHPAYGQKTIPVGYGTQVVRLKKTAPAQDAGKDGKPGKLPTNWFWPVVITGVGSVALITSILKSQ